MCRLYLALCLCYCECSQCRRSQCRRMSLCCCQSVQGSIALCWQSVLSAGGVPRRSVRSGTSSRLRAGVLPDILPVSVCSCSVCAVSGCTSLRLVVKNDTKGMGISRPPRYRDGLTHSAESIQSDTVDVPPDVVVCSLWRICEW